MAFTLIALATPMFPASTHLFCFTIPFLFIRGLSGHNASAQQAFVPPFLISAFRRHFFGRCSWSLLAFLLPFKIFPNNTTKLLFEYFPFLTEFPL